MFASKSKLPREYVATLKEKNQSVLLLLKNVLEQRLDKAFGLEGTHSRLRLLVAATGSDGRLEKSHLSKTELMIILGPGVASATNLVQDMQRVFTEAKCPFLDRTIVVDPSLEVKSIGDTLSYVFGSSDRTFPARILDAYPLVGDERLISLARTKLVEEWVGPEGRRIKDRVSGRAREYRLLMLSGKHTIHGQEIVHYDLGKGEFYYTNGSDTVPVSRSLKYGPLRFVQTYLVHELIKLVRSYGSDAVTSVRDLFLSLPQNTVEKLDFLGAERRCKLSKDELSDVANSYALFLFVYGLSETNYRTDGSTVLVPNPSEVQEIRERITAINQILSKPMFEAK